MYKLKRVTRKTWAGKEKFDLASDKIGPVLGKYGHPVTGLTEEDARVLEEKMNLPKLHLAPNSVYWDDFYVLLAGETREFDESIPDDELAIKFLKAHKLVADGIDKSNTSPNKLFVIYQEKEVHKNEALSFRDRNKAVEIYNSLSVNDMIDILAVAGHNVKNLREDAIDTIDGMIGKLIDSDTKKFISIASDKTLKYKIVVVKAIQFGVLRKDKAHIDNSTIYFNGEALGFGLDNAVAYLVKPENSGTLQYIKAALDQASTKATKIVTDEIIEASQETIKSMNDVMLARTANKKNLKKEAPKDDSSPVDAEPQEFIP